MDPIYPSIASAFSRQCGFFDAFTEVCLSFERGTMSPSEDERIHEKYGTCVIPFYECVSSTTGLRLAFTAFKIEVLKHLVMVPS